MHLFDDVLLKVGKMKKNIFKIINFININKKYPPPVFRMMLLQIISIIVHIG